MRFGKVGHSELLSIGLGPRLLVCLKCSWRTRNSTERGLLACSILCNQKLRSDNGKFVFYRRSSSPVFLIVALGYLLKRLALINEKFVILTSRFVFSVSLPVLMFMELSSVDLHDAFNPKLITYVCAGTLLSCALGWIVSIPFTRDGREWACSYWKALWEILQLSA